MNDVVERCLNTFGMMQNLTDAQLNERRAELSDYITKLHAGGENDENRLAVSGLTFLRQEFMRKTSSRARPTGAIAP